MLVEIFFSKHFFSDLFFIVFESAETYYADSGIIAADASQITRPGICFQVFAENRTHVENNQLCTQ